MKTETYEVLKQLPLRKENGEPWQPGERVQLAARAAKYLLLSGLTGNINATGDILAGGANSNHHTH